jgi:hypothetical protein
MKKCNITHSTGFSSAQFTILKSAEINDLEEPKNITTVKWSMEQFFTAATWHLTTAVVKYKKIWNKVILGKHKSQQNIIIRHCLLKVSKAEKRDALRENR